MKTIGFFGILLMLAAAAWTGELSVTEWEQLNADMTAALAEYADQVAAGQAPPIKCGTAIINELQAGRPKEAASMALFTEREDTMSFTHGTDHFLLHYTDNGANRVYEYDVQDLEPGTPDYIVRAGLIFENVYQREIDLMGFTAPPFDGTNGGDGRMDVYFIHNAFYGATVRDEILPTLPMTATSYIFIENDYAGFPGYQDNPDAAVQVSAAHEFFHTVQFGIDITEQEVIESVQNPAWIEMSATFMEEELYPHVNDYFNYVPFFYGFPQWSLRTGTTRISPEVANFQNLHMYGSVVWPLFLRMNFGTSIIKDIWDGCGETPGPNWWQATDSAIMAASNDTLDIRSMFREFTLWNLFTDTWALSDTTRYFPEARFYRLPQFLDPVTSYPAVIDPYNPTDLDSLYPDNLGANYILLRDIPAGIAIAFNPDRSQPWGLQIVKFWGGIDDSIEFDETVYDSSTTQIIIDNAFQYEQIVLIPSVLGGDSLRNEYTVNITLLEEGLSQPNGGEVLYAGDTVDIVWYYADSVTSVLLELSKDNGATWQDIVTTDNTFFYKEWEVPNSPSDSCLIRVSNVDNPAQSDVSDAVFSIRATQENLIADPYPNPAWVQRDDGITFKAVRATGDEPDGEGLSVYIMTVAGEKIWEAHSEPSIGATAIDWNFTNNEGKTVAAGVYLAVIRFSGQTETKKVVVLR